jgi:phospholipid transport system transporter-binding protein
VSLDTCQLEASGEGLFSLRGPLLFQNAGAVLERSEALFGGHRSLRVDLSGLTQVDSAGLALLLEWLRRARSRQGTLEFLAAPDRLRALARLSGTEEILLGNSAQG